MNFSVGHCGFRDFPELLKNDLRNYTNEYFALHQTTDDHDLFFGFFTPAWWNLVQRHHFFESIKIWNLALDLAIDWQNNNKPRKIHKGTPYYFLGVTAILNNELENGFLAMHQAMKEDERRSERRRPEAPAYWFITLDSSHRDQFFVQKVEEVATYLEERLYEYSTTRGRLLRLHEFRRRFLRLRYLSDEVFFFVYSLFRIRKMIYETGKIYKQNAFSSLLQARILFDLSLVVDKVIENKNAGRSNRPTIREEILFLSQNPRNLLSFNEDTLSELNDRIENNFGTTTRGLLLGTYRPRRHPILNDIERDFALAYGIRNRGAHKLENQPIIYRKMRELTQSLLNALFFTVENLY